MRSISARITLSIVLLMLGCKKSPELQTDYVPVFNSTVEVNVSEEKIGLKASFTQLNTAYADNSGFEWSEKEGSKITLFNVGKPGSGEIVMQIDTALRESKKYKTRAWIEVGGKVFYSGYAYFAGLGYPAPVITSLNKDYAYWGESIIIKGKYFSKDYYNDEIIVKIDNQKSYIEYASENEIHVTMPHLETKGKVKLSLKIVGKEAGKEIEIENYRPEVYSVSPQSIAMDGTITIKGKFRSNYKNLVVPVQKEDYYYPEYTIVKYADDEIILKRGTYMYCDSLYTINFRLREFKYDNFEFINTGFSVKRTGNWIRLKNTPFNAFDKGLTFNGKGYVIQFQGLTGTFPFWRYDPQSDQWTKLASFPGNYRIDPVFLECNGFIYCGLGKKDDKFYELMTDFWKYDPVSNAWSKSADLNFKSKYGVSIFGANIRDTVFVFSEWNNQKAKYNAADNSWVISDCYVPRLHDFSSSFIFNGEYYFFSDLYQNNMYKYNLIISRFDQIYLNNMDRSGATAFNVKGRIFSKFNCGFSEIDMVNANVIELYDYSDYLSGNKTSRFLFVINNNPYFTFEPNGLITVDIE